VRCLSGGGWWRGVGLVIRSEFGNCGFGLLWDILLRGSGEDRRI